MDKCLISCRSLTYAQRAAKALNRAAYNARVTRLPSKLTERGCEHAVSISCCNLDAAIAFLQENGLDYTRVYRMENDELKEL